MLTEFLEPDVMLPVQLINRPAVRGEERLMLAVLRDALLRFQKYALATDRRGRRLFSEVDDWIQCRDRSWPFSFENICEVLQIDSGYVRSELERWRQRSTCSRRFHAPPDEKCMVPPTLM
jgi:hypothetical protein